MGVIRYKILYDLLYHKARTLQVVLIIAMGAFAIGMIIGSRNLVIAGMEDIWRASSPAMIALSVNSSVDEDIIRALKRIPGLEDVEGFSSTTIEWRLSPDDQWLPAGLIARDDYQDQRYLKLGLISGEWPQDRVFAVGLGGDTVFDIPEGGQVYIRVNDRDHVVKIGGIIYDPISQPPGFGGSAQFYTTRNRIGELTDDRDFNQILAGAPEYDEVVLTDIANEMQKKLEKQGVNSAGFLPPNGDRISDPTKHFFQDILDGVFLVLGVMAIFALILGLFLVYNTINAIITQQVDQIGIMKAIGAGTKHILFIYLINVFVYGFLALLIAIPLGAIGAWALNLFLLNTFNAEPGSFTISPPAIQAQVAIALLAPLLASLGPIFTGARLTVREAISTYGLSTKAGLLERLLAKIENINRLLLLIISNTFRHKGRVVLTQITLVLSGLIFMMVMSVSDSATHTFGDVLFSILRFNVNLVFENPERIKRVEKLTLAHPDVTAVEMWGLDRGTIWLTSQAETNDDEAATMFGVPLPTTLYGPQMRAGRWLLPEDKQAVVLNQRLAEEAGISLGDWITFDHGLNRESTWQVVGFLFDPVVINSAHVPREVMLREIGRVGRTSTVWIQTVRDDPASEAAIARNLRDLYEQNQLKLNPQGIFDADTASEITTQILNNYGVIITVLAIMAILIGLVGSIALSGVLSLNVLERRREIGVMRAIGASSSTMACLFIGEGLILGWLSWLIALPLSIPAGQLMTQAVGAAVQTEIVYNYTPAGALIWLGLITILSIAASLFPAQRAMRISVRESLAYQ